MNDEGKANLTLFHETIQKKRISVNRSKGKLVKETNHMR